jgi:hypothetical protein
MLYLVENYLKSPSWQVSILEFSARPSKNNPVKRNINVNIKLV